MAVRFGGSNARVPVNVATINLENARHKRWTSRKQAPMPIQTETRKTMLFDDGMYLLT